MQSLRSVIGAGLAGLALVATAAAGSPAYAAPAAAARLAPEVNCASISAMNLGCQSAAVYASLASLAPAGEGSLDRDDPAGQRPGQAPLTVLTGSETRFFGPPSRVFVLDGWTQVRGVRLTGTFTFHDANNPGVTLAGTESVFTNASLGPGNNGYTWGTMTYTFAATGLKCTGSVNGRITNALGTLTVVAPCRNGGMLVGRVQDVSTDPPNVAPPKSVTSNFDGVLLGPGNR